MRVDTSIYNRVATFATRAPAVFTLAIGLMLCAGNGRATTLVVDDDGFGTSADCNDVVPCFSTINAALTVALAGDIILVCPGTYTENITINKQLTLQGAQAGVAACGRVVGAPNPATESIITGPAPGATIVTLISGSAGTVVDGFSIIGGTRALESATGPIDNVIIRNNHIAGFTSAGTFLNDPGVDVTVTRNNVDGSNKVVGAGGSVHFDTDAFKGLYVTNNCIVNGARGPGMFVDGANNVNPSVNRTPLIDGNRFENQATDVGANLGSRAFIGGNISNNVFINNAFDGLQGGIQNSTVSGNRFDNNGRWGLALTSFGNLTAARGAVNCLVTGNIFTANDSAGLFYSASMFPTHVTSDSANFNDFVGNGPGGGLGYGVVYRGVDSVNVKCNWWGDTGGPDYPPTHSNPPADGLYANHPAYSPWLTGSITGSPTCDQPVATEHATWGRLKSRYR